MQRQLEADVISTEDFAELKRVVLDEAMKTYQAMEAAKRRRIDSESDADSACSTPLKVAGGASASSQSSPPLHSEHRRSEKIDSFFT